MSVMEAQTIDMAQLMTSAYDLGDLILASVEAADYFAAKKRLSEDPEAQSIIREFNRKKQLFEECERFGHFHPDYHSALEQARLVEAKMNANPSIKTFREAEEHLDGLLYEISKSIANAVSETIKVPSNTLIEEGGCSSGSCSGSCGSCG